MNQSELKKLYSAKTNTELIEINNSIHDYSKEAIEAIEYEISQRGGLEFLSIEFEQLVLKDSEIEKCYKFIQHSLSEGKQKKEIRNEIQLEQINEEEYDSIYTECKHEYDELIKNKKVTFKSLFGGVIGGLIGSVVGGVVWGMMMVGSNRIFYLVGFGLVLISYFFVWLFSRKDKNNAGTIILTIVSVILALVIGQTIYEIRGPMEYLN